MATGACGINCDVCRLNLLGLCTTCGPGKSKEAQIKLAAQERVLNDTCPILSCACLNQKAHCMRDCSQFPCDNFTLSPYPFSDAYLEMQKRRRVDWVPSIDPLGKPVEVPDEYWETLQKKDFNLLKSVTLAETDEEQRLIFPFLDLELRVDPIGKQITQKQKDGQYKPLDVPLLTLTVLIYFNAVDRLFPMGKDLVSTQDMGGQGNYFTGGHELKTNHILGRFSQDPDSLNEAIETLGGTTLDMGDQGWVLYPFPRIGVYYLFWDLDTKYDTRLSILFDRQIKNIFTPPMVWELVNLVNGRLISA
ncbi:MAG: DUF3786 domain-containing protein [Desulfobacterales bacterium]|nr:DUF3786 domain-containing protein [Desulfobacterales bacterium]